MTNRVRSFSVLIACLGASACAAPVTVSVSVETPAGAPIADAPVQVYSDDGAAFGLTSANGTVTLTIELEPGDPDIVARLWDGSFHLDLSPDDRALAVSQFDLLRQTYHFAPHYFAQTDPAETQYQIEIEASPAIEATGRLVDDQGVPIPDASFGIGARGGQWFGVFRDAAGVFTMHGIRQGTSTELVVAMRGPQSFSIPLTAQQTAQNVDLGDVVVQRVDRPVELDMTLTNADDLYDPGDIALWTQVSLIRSDAQVVLTFPVRPPNGEVVADIVQVQTDVPRTTEGVYYLVPGPVTSPTAFALLDALRAGQQAQLDAAGVPKITAVAGQTTQLVLEGAQARSAVLAATAQGQ